MKCSGLLTDLQYEIINKKTGFEETDISNVCNDTRKIEKNCIFVCIKGVNADTHDMIDEIAQKGAAVIVIDHDIDHVPDCTVLKVSCTRFALSILSAAYFGYPARKLTTIALTGTKGKSTSAYMIRNILERCGHKTGIIGTIGVGIGDKIYPTVTTTPDPYTVQKYLAQMVKEGCDSLVMEVSSQAMKQSRVAGIVYDYALFTNLEPDHIGPKEHESLEEYMFFKSLLFRQCRFALGNGDDPHFEDVVRGKAKAPEGYFSVSAVVCNKVESFGYGENCDYRATDIRLIGEGGEIGIAFTALTNLHNVDITLSIPGRFNVMNALGAISVCSHILLQDAGQDENEYKRLLNEASKALYDTHVKGRLEPVKISNRFALMIDYAHNAMALESLLTTLREHKPGRLVCLFGCGGNRSKERRYEMGEVSSRLADLTVVTTDNPRFEEPMDIINDILEGVKKADGKYIVIPDRKEAIRSVIENALDNDLIVLAGKGHEDYQEIKGVKYHMDERELVADVVKDLMAERGYI